MLLGAFVATLGLTAAHTFALSPPPAEAAVLPCEGNNPDRASVPASDYYPGYNRTRADEGKAITPDEVLARAVDWDEANPTYCQSDTFPDRHGKQYRPDCSGFVSMAWHLPGYPRTTHTLPEVSTRIPIDEVQPGDALINDHHTELVWAVEGSTITTIGFGSTPVDHQTLSFVSAEMTYDAYRYNNMQVVTDEMIRAMIRRHLPNPQPTIQPPGRESVVNWDTMFHINPDGDNDADTIWQTDPMQLEDEEGNPVGDVQVRLRATATNFLWNFASPDRAGEPQTTPANANTEHPGTAFEQPGPKVIHKYMTAKTFHPSVDVTWTRYQYQIVGDDEGWQDVDGEHTSDGPEIDLTIREFSSLLTR